MCVKMMYTLVSGNETNGTAVALLASMTPAIKSMARIVNQFVCKREMLGSLRGLGSLPCK